MKYRFFLGRLKPQLIKRYGLWHAGYYPPFITGYWLLFCIGKGNFKLMPLIIMDGIAELAGMFTGFIDIARGKMV